MLNPPPQPLRWIQQMEFFQNTLGGGFHHFRISRPQRGRQRRAGSRSLAYTIPLICNVRFAFESGDDRRGRRPVWAKSRHRTALFDHLIGAVEQGLGHRQAERSGYNWQISRFNMRSKVTWTSSILVSKIGPVGGFILPATINAVDRFQRLSQIGRRLELVANCL